MKNRNQLVEHYAREAWDEIREAETQIDDKRTGPMIIESALLRYGNDLQQHDFERGSELLRSLQRSMMVKK